MNFALIRQQIANLLIAHPELAEDEILRADMIEGATDAHEFLRLLERRRQEAEHLGAAIAANMTTLGERAARMSRREEAMRNLMLLVMQAADLRKVELPEATVSVRPGSERLVILDEPSVPHEFCRVKYSPDKAKIKALLQAGNRFNWAALETGHPFIAIRTK